MLLDDDPNVFAFQRTGTDDQLLVFGNFSGAPQVVTLPSTIDLAGSQVVIANYAPQSQGAASGTLTLRPWEAIVFQQVTSHV